MFNHVHVFSQICAATRLELCRHFLSTLPPTKMAIFAETCHESKASKQQPERKSQCHSHTCAAESSSTLHPVTFPHVPSLFHTNLSFAQCERHSALPAVTCERLQTVAVAQTTSREQESTPRPPDLNENPSLSIRENNNPMITPCPS